MRSLQEELKKYNVLIMTPHTKTLRRALLLEDRMYALQLRHSFSNSEHLISFPSRCWACRPSTSLTLLSLLSLSANDPNSDPALNSSGERNSAQAAHEAKPGVQVLDSQTASKLEEPLSEFSILLPVLSLSGPPRVTISKLCRLLILYSQLFPFTQLLGQDELKKRSEELNK